MTVSRVSGRGNIPGHEDTAGFAHLINDDHNPSHAPRPDPAATRTFDQLALREDPLLGQMVGNYHLLARAGQGAHGTVYRARDVRLDRTVAVKFLDGATTPEARARFEREARAIARLGKHPHVVDVHAWGEHEGRCYIALEYLPESAASLLARHPHGLPAGQALRIIDAAARGLEAAHQAGLVHGDIKPSNILLSEDLNEVKLCDFGLAQTDATAPAQGGSPAYLAPECLHGQPVSVASDLYALAATLHALLTGHPPVSTDPPSFAAMPPGLPSALVSIVHRALSVDPERRPHSANAFAEALRQASEKQPREARNRRWWQGGLRVAAAALLIFAGSVALMLAQGFLPGGAGSTVLLADARLSLNQGDYDAARTSFEQYLKRQPENAEARYGLAYAFLLEGDHERAAAEFARVGEAAMREEGEAAIAYMASGEAARPALEHAATDHRAGYAAVLLSMLDLMSGDFAAARTRLDRVSESDLKFEWQRRQYLQTLGQLYFKSGDYAAAEETFARLEQAGPEQHETFASGYAALARRRADTMQREDVGERLARLKELRDTRSETTEDAWTSRPLAVWIPPVDAGNGVIATESGLVDVLPWRLGLAFAEESRVSITPVERGAEADILAEQELSAALGNPEEALRLGRVIGARLLLIAKVTRLMGEELLHLTLVDVETTRQMPVGGYPIRRDLVPGDWIRTLMDDLVRVVSSAYPLRGRITLVDGRPVLNLGLAVGVAEGTPFQATSGNAGQPGVHAAVTRVIDERQSEVALTGIEASALPAEGLKVEHAQEASHAP